MAKVMLVSEVKLPGESLYVQELTTRGHNVNQISSPWGKDRPDLSDKLREFNPDAIVLTTASTVPAEHRRGLYEDLRKYGKPIRVIDSDIIGDPIQVSEGDRCINPVTQREGFFQLLAREVDDLVK